MAYVFHGVIRFLASALARDGLAMASQTFSDRYLVVTTDKGNAVTEIRKLPTSLLPPPPLQTPPTTTSRRRRR
jgi:hypothetical protein